MTYEPAPNTQAMLALDQMADEVKAHVERGLPFGGPPAFYAPLAPIDPPTQED